MRVEITAQATTRDTLAAFILAIGKTLAKNPHCLGEKYGQADWGWSWEIVPDEHEQTKP